MSDPGGRLRLAAWIGTAAGLWLLTLGTIPDDPEPTWGPAKPLVGLAEARPWLVYAAALGAAWLALRALGGASVPRRRLALAVPLVAASLVPAVPGLAHWSLYGVFGSAAVVVTAAWLERTGAIGWPELRRLGPGLRGWIAAAAAAQVVVTALLSVLLFGGVPHVQDSVVQLVQARIFLSGAAAAAAPPVAAAFEYSHMVEHAGRWFSIYPPGHSLLLAAGAAIGLPQVVNPLAGALALVGIALLARDVLGERGARWALFVALVSPFWLLMHAGFMNHSTAHTALVWGVFWWRRSTGRGSPWAGLAAGLLFGLAFAIRPYTAVLVGAALAATAAIRWKPRAVAACTWTAVGALPGIALALGHNALTTGDPLVFGYVARFGDAHLPGFHPTPWGPPHTPARGMLHVLADLNGLNRYLLAWPLPFTVLVGAAAAAGLRVREAWLATVPLALLVGHFFYWYADFCFGPRMVFESFFALAILGAQALDTLVRRTGRRAVWLIAVAVVGSVPLWTHLLSGFGDAYWGVDATESRAVAAAAPADALVFVTGNYGGYLWRNDPHLAEGPVYVRHRGGAADRTVRAAFPNRTPYLQRGRELVEAPP